MHTQICTHACAHIHMTCEHACTHMRKKLVFFKVMVDYVLGVIFQKEKEVTYLIL